MSKRYNFMDWLLDDPIDKVEVEKEKNIIIILEDDEGLHPITYKEDN